MSKYTTEVRFICEHAAGMTESTGYSGIGEVINKAIPSVFSFDFPIFDESYRNVLCKKILMHYYTREICEESVGLWKLRLDTRLNEIMPYYNKLYESELLVFNPLYDTDITKRGNRDNASAGNEGISSKRDRGGNSETNARSDSSSSSNTNETNNVATDDKTNSTNTTTTVMNTSRDSVERDMYSETPQGSLQNVEAGDYLTNARKKTGEDTENQTGNSTGTGETIFKGNTDTTTDSTTQGQAHSNGNTTTVTSDTDVYTSTQNNTANSTEEYLENVIGKQGGASYSKLLMEYRETFLNIDMQVINALADLFFGLW